MDGDFPRFKRCEIYTWRCKSADVSCICKLSTAFLHVFSRRFYISWIILCWSTGNLAACRSRFFAVVSRAAKAGTLALDMIMGVDRSGRHPLA